MKIALVVAGVVVLGLVVAKVASAAPARSAFDLSSPVFRDEAIREMTAKVTVGAESFGVPRSVTVGAGSF